MYIKMMMAFSCMMFNVIVKNNALYFIV